MKVLELDLRAYGLFSNKTLEFDESVGLHLIVGPNEAGKSTVLRALRGALCGIKGTSDTQVYSKDMLRVGLKVRTADGQVLHVERRAGRGARSLVFAPAGKAVPVEEWARVLPVESAELFEQMFALNYERLLEGGKQLAEFKNDVGQALLAAAGDLGQTVTRMHAMEARAEAIYSPRATSSLLRKALASYQDADKRFREERFLSRDFKAAVARREELVAELERITEERAGAGERQNRMTRTDAAAPHVRRLLEDESALVALAGSVPLAPDFEARFAAASGGWRAAGEHRQQAASELERLEAEFAQLPRDPALAGLAAEIDTSKDLTGKTIAARVDCPKREGELRQLSIRREGLCARLGLAADAAPRLAVESRRRIERLAGERLVLDARRKELPEKMAALEFELVGQQAALEALAPEGDTAELAERLAQVRARKQAEPEAKRLRAEWEQASLRMESDLRRLPWWTGTAVELDELRAPLNASVSEFAARFVQHETRAQQLAATANQCAQAFETASAAVRAIERQKSIPTEADLRDARARRDTGWAAVKDRWLGGVEGGAAETSFLDAVEAPLPEAYEAAVGTADSVADRLRSEADRVEQKRAALDALELAERRLSDADREREQHRQELTSVEAQWRELWTPAGIVPRSPKEMQAWLETRAALVAQRRECHRLAEQVREIEGEVRGWRESLASLLGEGRERTLDELVARGDALARQAAELRRVRGECSGRIRELAANLERARGEERRKEAALAEWRVEWRAAIAGLPVSEEAEPAAVQEVVSLVDEVLASTEEMAGLQYRIDRMLAEDAAYVRTVRALAEHAGKLELSAGDAVAVIRELQEASRRARDAETTAATLVESRRREERKQRAAEVAVARFQAELEQLRREAGVSEASLLPAAIATDQKRRALESRIEEHRRALAASSGNLALDEFIAQVRAADLDRLPIELEGVREEIGRLEEARSEIVSARDGIDREFAVREAAVQVREAAADRFSAAARIDELTREYLEQRLGAALLAKAIARYRERNQDPLLERAGEYFATLTGGAFTGLAIDDVDSQRVLRGVRTGGKRLAVDAMSDGTRDPLYLALRLAYIEDCCAKGAPCPVILDDVLMAYDDARTGAALSALRDLSRRTQVLVFTHHRHHIALAERVLAPGEYALHELTARATATV